MKYIPADKLTSEIERRMSENLELAKAADCFGHRAVEDNDILSLIDSLQQEQPEVDLNKEINRFWDSCIKHKNERGGNVIWSNKLEVEVLARHFFDLGLNARKEESK